MDTTKPTVTIGIPVYNEEKYLARTIESAINQHYQNLEIIISDNCSTDSSYQIAQEFAKKDSRIKLIKQKKNIGATENFKFVLEKATSEYFCWLGAHDIFLNEYISLATNELESDTSISMVYPVSRFIDANDTLLEIGGSDIHTQGLELEEALCKVVNNLGNCVAIHGIFRTSVAQKLPFVKTIGPDMLMLFATAFYGHIVHIEYEGIHRREVRIETFQEAIERYKSWEIYSNEHKNPFALLLYEHYKFLFLRSDMISWRKNMRLFKRLKSIFTKKYGVNTHQITQVIKNKLFLYISGK